MKIKIKSLSFLSYGLLVAGIGVVYFLTAQLSLLFAFEQTHTSPVWPPAGIAFLVILYLGYRFWPGILIGVFIANMMVFVEHPSDVMTVSMVLNALIIAVGSTLEPVIGVLLFRHFIGTGKSLNRSQDVSIFVCAIALSCLSSSFIGPLSLCFFGFASFDIFGVMWFTWWLGNLSGVLIIAPIFLGWHQKHPVQLSVYKWIELSLVFGLLIFMGLFVFDGWPDAFGAFYSLDYMIIPILLWLTFRFGQQISAIALAFVSGMAIWATVNGSGPFLADSVGASLILLQSFVCVLAITINILSVNIFEKRDAIDSLREGQAHLRTLIDAIPDLVWLKDLNGVYIACNSRFEQFYGAKENQIKGKTDYEFVDKERADFFREKDADVIAADTTLINEEYVTFSNDGHKELLEKVKTPMRDSNGNLMGVLGIARDITGREERQFELRLKNLAFESAIMANSAADANGILTHVNQMFLKVWGYEKKEEVIGRSIGEFLKFEEEAELIINALNETGTWEGEYIGLKKDGTIFVAYGLATIICDTPGIILGYQSSVLDISDRKKAEEEKIITQKLAGEREKLALVGQVAGKMAHDFNNVLGIIMGNTELSLLECQEVETKKTLELIYEQTIRGKNLTKNLVAFAQDQEPKQEFFKINEKTNLVLSLLKKDLEGIELIKEDKPDIPELLADPGMIEHAFVNLIQNAIHAVSLSRNPKIIVRTFYLKDTIYIEIEDNGCGIPEKYMDHIFEPSFTLKGAKDTTGSYKKMIKGTGYGMANVKKYIEQHKGDIFVESNTGSGTKITVGLPIVKKELSATEKKQIRKSNLCSGRYILLVEDEQAISDIQYRILTQEPNNHKVDIASNGKVAIDLFDRNTYECVSLDYLLPGNLNGMDVYQHIRQTNKTIPILFISGNIEFLESIQDLKQKDPHIDHVSKPCRNIDYVNCVNTLLETEEELLKPQ